MDDGFIARARHEDLVVEKAGGEALVYDLTTNKAHCLNETAASVWELCDGRMTVAGIADALGAGPDVVWLALSQLERRKLLAQPLPAAGLTRRRMLARIGVAGAIGIALPVVRSIVAPTAAQAATCVDPGGACTTSAQCCSGVCLANNTCL